MKKIIFYALWTFICLHTTITFADAASGTIESALAKIDAIIANTGSGEVQELNSAPVYQMGPVTYAGEPQGVWSSWELIHRTPMLQGFVWTGATANFITPNMYIGTPLETNMGIIGYNSDIGPTNYTECVRAETDASFGMGGSMMENTTQKELMNIAKYCAVEFYGTYFDGKKYTTREEMLMLLFTMFDEGIELPGYFDGSEFVFEGDETRSPYKNVSSKAWFAPYITVAKELNMIPSYTEWSIAKAVTPDDITEMINAFTEYRIAYDGNIATGGRIIQTEHGYYRVEWDDGFLILSKNF